VQPIWTHTHKGALTLTQTHTDTHTHTHTHTHIYIYMFTFFPGVTTHCGCIFTARYRALASSFSRYRDHTQRRATVSRTPLDEWSIRRRDLWQHTTHNTHNTQTSMPPVGFETTISADERPKTYALDRAATGTGMYIRVYIYTYIYTHTHTNAQKLRLKRLDECLDGRTLWILKIIIRKSNKTQILIID